MPRLGQRRKWRHLCPLLRIREKNVQVVRGFGVRVHLVEDCCAEYRHHGSRPKSGSGQGIRRLRSANKFSAGSRLSSRWSRLADRGSIALYPRVGASRAPMSAPTLSAACTRPPADDIVSTSRRLRIGGASFLEHSSMALRQHPRAIELHRRLDLQEDAVGRLRAQRPSDVGESATTRSEFPDAAVAHRSARRRKTRGSVLRLLRARIDDPRPHRRSPPDPRGRNCVGETGRVHRLQDWS